MEHNLQVAKNAKYFQHNSDFYSSLSRILRPFSNDML